MWGLPIVQWLRLFSAMHEPLSLKGFHVGKLTVYVWRVSVPLHARMANAEAVGVSERSREVDAVDFRAGLDVVHVVQPARGGQDVGVPAGTDLRLGPAALNVVSVRGERFV